MAVLDVKNLFLLTGIVYIELLSMMAPDNAVIFIHETKDGEGKVA